jgi:hypothetical protein
MLSFCRRSLMHSFLTLDASEPKFWPAKCALELHLRTRGSNNAFKLTHFEPSFHSFEGLLELVVARSSYTHRTALFSDCQPGVQ